MHHDVLHNNEKIIYAMSECSAWLATLNLLKEESYALKSKLSEALDNTKNHEKKLGEILSKNPTDRQWMKPQEKLRNEIAYLERDFSEMRTNFYRVFFNEQQDKKS